jgi:uncharacterized protein (TIGR03083 family)
METSRYLDCLGSDYAALYAAASAAGLGAPVPSCPGWTVADLVTHVGEVYLHKVAAMRTMRWPDQWPPDFDGEQPMALLARAYGELTAELTSREPDAPSLTWHRPDQTVRFWMRRMAQETVVHRMDAQLAAGVPVSKVPDDLAVDGVDEVLKLFLGYGSTSWPREYAAAAGGNGDGKNAVAVVTGGRSWTVRPSPRDAAVTDGADSGAVRATITAEPEPMLRWLWGRAGDDAVRVTGDPASADYLRRLLVALTQ